VGSSRISVAVRFTSSRRLSVTVTDGPPAGLVGLWSRPLESKSSKVTCRVVWGASRRMLAREAVPRGPQGSNLGAGVERCLGAVGPLRVP
jgi:hypothetical protein